MPDNADFEDAKANQPFEIAMLSHWTTVYQSPYSCQGGVVAQPAFGFLLQRLREQRGLSLRELAQLAVLITLISTDWKPATRNLHRKKWSQN